MKPFLGLLCCGIFIGLSAAFGWGWHHARVATVSMTTVVTAFLAYGGISLIRRDKRKTAAIAAAVFIGVAVWLSIVASNCPVGLCSK